MPWIVELAGYLTRRIFEGTQPTLTQVPPRGSPLLIITAFTPRSEALVAEAKPPAPPPMIIRSYFSVTNPPKIGCSDIIDNHTSQVL